MHNSKSTPRVSHIRKQYDVTTERLRVILNSSTGMYSSTKEQIWDIYRMMLSVQDDIIERLGEPPADIKERTDTVTMTKAEVTSMFKSFTEQYDEKLKLERHNTNTVKERITIIERENTEDCAEMVEHTVSDTTSTQQVSQTSSVRKGKFTSEYSKGYKSECTKLLKRMCDYDYESADAKEIVQLMNRWYTLRFNTDYGQKYTYGVNQITEGFYSIVLAYAEHKVQNTVSNLMASFDKWADSLSTNSQAAKSWTMPYQLNPIMRDIHNDSDENIVVHPQTIILWWAIIEPFRQDIERISAKYNVFINPDYIDMLAYDYGYDTTVTDIANICPDKHISYSVLTQYQLD